MNKFRIILLTISFITVMVSCNNDDIDFKGTDNLVASFALEKEGTKYYAMITADSIIVSVPKNVSLAGATPGVIISEKATIIPDPASVTDWDQDMEFTVKAYNGTQTIYKYVVKHKEWVHNGNVKLQSQADVDAFATLGYTTLDGSLYIATEANADTIKSLAALSQLKSIKYEFQIGENFKGNNLDGLENLENAATIAIGNRYRAKMDSLTHVALPSLKSVNNTLSVLASGTKTIDFPVLQSVGGDFRVQNDSLYSCNTPALETVGGEYNLWYTRNLSTISVPELKKVGTFSIASVQGLVSVELPKLKEAITRFRIASTPKLKKVYVPVMERSGSLELEGNSVIEEADFSSLAVVDGRVDLYYVKVPVNLRSLTTVKGLLMIPQTDDFSIFGALKSVEGSLSIYVAPNCMSLAGFESLTTVGENLTVSGGSDYNLSDLSGLRSLTTIGKNLTVNGFQKITGLSDLTSLSTVGEAMDIRRLGITHLSSVNLPEKLKNLDQLIITEMPLQELDIKGLGVKRLTLDYMSRYTDNVKVMGDNVLEYAFIEDNKRVEFTDVTEIKELTLWPNGTRGYGVEITGIKKAGTANLYHGRDYLNMPDLEEVTGTLTIYDNTTLSKLKSAGSMPNSNAIWSNTLPELTTVNGDFFIYTGSSITSTSSIELPKIKTIEGKLTISGRTNTNLKDLNGLSALTVSVRYRFRGIPH